MMNHLNTVAFVIPFFIAVLFFFGVLFTKFFLWIRSLSAEQKKCIRANIFTTKSVKAIGEMVRESLLHLKIYRRNLLLGYMHMSFALGWFLLIVVGKIEASIYKRTLLEDPSMAVFFRYFSRESPHFLGKDFFAFVMDFLLLVLLSGLVLALLKRLRSRALGLKKATSHRAFDKMVLLCLWCVFPLRLLAESATAALVHNGGFLTNSVGKLLSIFPLERMELPLWWAYSSVLSLFLCAIPFTRYMHIPTELLLIFLRRWGVKIEDKSNGFSIIQLNACSACGICIDTCQLNSQAQVQNVQSVHFVREVRHNTLSEKLAGHCLLCGRCDFVCPVGLDLVQLRAQSRDKNQPASIQLKEVKSALPLTEKVEVVFFSGCMTQLLPTIGESMKKIFEKAGVNAYFLDENQHLCCGRPLRQQGFLQDADQLVRQNTELIQSFSASFFVTPCPICYRSFREEYHLNIPVLHHSEFLESLLKQGRISIQKANLRLSYHDPCELGRGSGVYEPARQVLRSIGELLPLDEETSLCCGGSLGNISIDQQGRNAISKEVMRHLKKGDPDFVATACPLCKKTLAKANPSQKVYDLAELLAQHLEHQ